MVSGSKVKAELHGSRLARDGGGPGDGCFSALCTRRLGPWALGTGVPHLNAPAASVSPSPSVVTGECCSSRVT